MSELDIQVNIEVVKSKAIVSVPIRMRIGSKITEHLLEIPLSRFKEIPTAIAETEKPEPNPWIPFNPTLSCYGAPPNVEIECGWLLPDCGMSNQTRRWQASPGIGIARPLISHLGYATHWRKAT